MESSFARSVSGSFKSCPREGASAGYEKKGDRASLVSSHAPVRGHHHSLSCIQPNNFCVSSHAPVRGHLPSLDGTMIKKSSFKSCPREGASSAILPELCPAGIVSSHAPVRGHLQFFHPTGSRRSCFKSCPREGASKANIRQRSWRTCFKSCPREGASRQAYGTRAGQAGFKSCPREGASL